MPVVYILDGPSNDLNKLEKLLPMLSQPTQTTVSKPGTPAFAVVVLAAIFVIGLFVVGYDQGHIFSIVLGERAFDDLYIHELTHDMRHAAGFPCH